jgi:hypothetical protein
MFAPNDHYEPFWIWPAVFAGVAAIVGFVALLNRIVKRFFPSTQRKRYSLAMGNALMRVDAVLAPGREHIIEAREYQQVEEDEEGEPPETSGRHSTDNGHTPPFEDTKEWA